jgi:adenine-specific DNA methylase
MGCISWSTKLNRQLFWIATKRRAQVRPNRASVARSAAGRHAKKTNGFAHADTNGIPSTREASAQHASISGLRPSASLAADGRRIRCGTRIRENRETVRETTLFCRERGVDLEGVMAASGFSIRTPDCLSASMRANRALRAVEFKIPKKDACYLQILATETP